MATNTVRIEEIKSQIQELNGRVRVAEMKTNPNKKAAAQFKSQIETLEKELNNLQTDSVKKKEEKTKKEQISSKTYVPANIPAGADKLMKDILSIPGIDTSPAAVDALFAAGGLGNTMLVYMGRERVAPTGRPNAGGIRDNLQLATNITQSFWDDKTTKNKVKTLLASAGKPSDDLSAFTAWQQVVGTAASIYNGGKGPDLTPFDIMQMQIKNSGGPQKRVDKVDQNVLRALVENVYSSTAMRKPTPAEMEARLQELNKFVDAGTVTTTSGNTTVQTAGFTQAGAEQLVKKKVETEAPKDVARVQGLQFKDELSSWMRSGI